MPHRASAGEGHLQLALINYDGVVPRVESDEYAEIVNRDANPVNLGGWRLNAGDPGQDFGFSAFELQPGQSCRVYTNEFHPESCGFTFGRGQAIWNNGGDCGYLYDAAGNQVSQACGAEEELRRRKIGWPDRGAMLCAPGSARQYCGSRRS